MNESEKSINQAIGARIRSARIMCGFSQQQLAAQLGIAAQQQQKYEKGSNNVNACRLLAIAKVLGIPASYLLGEQEVAETRPPRRKFIHLIQALQHIEKEPVIFNQLHNMIITMARKL